MTDDEMEALEDEEARVSARRRQAEDAEEARELQHAADVAECDAELAAMTEAERRVILGLDK